MKQGLLIFPFNGNGLEALDCASDFSVLGFIDDTPEKIGRSKFGPEVFKRGALSEFPNAKILSVPGGPASYRNRAEIISGLQIEESRFATVIHARATVSPLSKIGYNVLIMAGAVVTSNAVIGNHVCILPNTVIHHDVSIGDYTLIGSNVSIAGGTSIGKNCYIGSGTRIINGIAIGDRVLTGLGSNVIRSIPADMKVAGNPARPL